MRFQYISWKANCRQKIFLTLNKNAEYSYDCLKNRWALTEKCSIGCYFPLKEIRLANLVEQFNKKISWFFSLGNQNNLFLFFLLLLKNCGWPLKSEKRKTKEKKQNETQINNNLFVERTTTTDYSNCSKQTTVKWAGSSILDYSIFRVACDCGKHRTYTPIHPCTRRASTQTLHTDNNADPLRNEITGLLKRIRFKTM